MIFSKIDECVKTFKDKNDKLMSFRIGNDKILENYKIIQTRIEKLKNIDLNCLPVYDVRDIKTKIRTYVCKNIESILS